MLPKFFFWLTSACALVLIGGVVVSPWLEPGAFPEWARLIRLFAHDATVRHTAIGCGIGLAVTAVVFFKPGLLRRKSRSPNEVPPVIGA